MVAITGGDNTSKRDIKEGIAKLNRVQQNILADLVTRRAEFFKAFLADYDYLDGGDLREVLNLTSELKGYHFSK